MSKKALLIGINYTNTSNQLYGCINDMIQWYSLLRDVYGFKKEDIVFLRDDKADFRPTKNRILSELQKVINSKSDYIFIGYSGHGTSTPDMNREEQDGNDECLVPSDYNTNGVITDDELNNIVKNNESIGLAVFDCCRSGTVLDLGFNGIKNTSVNPTTSKNKLICISGCQDNQLADEVYNTHNMLPQGLLTIILIDALRENTYYPKMGSLISGINNILVSSGAEQRPNITSSYNIDINTEFPFKAPINNSSLELNLTQQVTTLTTDKNTLTQQVASLTGEKNTLLQQNSSLSFDKNKLIAEKSILSSQINNLSNQINTLNKQTSLLNSDKSKLLQQINSLTQTINTLNTDKAKLATQINILNADKIKLNTQLNNALRSNTRF